ncbi:MAG: type VII secretion protein EccCb, partial [Thermocrispum sp.]
FIVRPHPAVEWRMSTLGKPAELDREEEPPQSEPQGEASGPSLATVLTERLNGAGPAARQVWLPPLSSSPSLDTLLPSVLPDPVLGMSVDDPAARGRLRVPLGVVDKPYEQLRELLVADLSGADGHAAVVGAPQSGKSTLLRTLLLGLALTNTPRQVQFYCLDFGGGGIMSISGLPHVGSVATRLERDRVVRTIEELLQILERRETLFAERGLESMTAYRELQAAGEIDDQHGDVFLVIDGWFSLRQDYSELETKIGELAARGLSFGLHVMVSAARWSEIRPWLRDLIGTRFELRLGDPMESEIGSRKAATVPTQPGRGLIGTGSHFLAALPRLDGSSDTDDLATATKTVAEEVATFWPGATAPAVRLLPTVLPAHALPEPEGLRVCLGQDEQRLMPVWHDFGVTPHLLVFGDTETGKTNLLRSVLASVLRAHPAGRVKFVLGDSRRQLDGVVPEECLVGHAITADALRELCGKASVTLGGRIPGENITAERLRARDWWHGPELFVVVDDYDLLAMGMGMGSTLDPLLAMLAQGVHIGLHVVVARSTSGALRGMMDPVLRRLWELGTPGLLFSYPKEEGKFLGEAAPRKLLPGRAQLVTRRDVKLVQTAFSDERTAS